MSFYAAVKNIGVYSFAVCCCLLWMLFSPVYAEEIDSQQQIYELQNRVESLESVDSEQSGSSKMKFGGLFSGAYQLQHLNKPYDSENGDHGAVVFQPDVTVVLSEYDELYVKFGFAAGNGLNDSTPFELAPWASPLEDDVKSINGRNRDYLLTAWYAHSFEFGEDGVLQLSVGIIDATDYLDQNLFSNDEHTQFMNEALVNAANTFFPSFDLGGAAVLNVGQFEIAAVGMNIAENDDGNGYNFYGAEFEYELESSIGNGVYRVIPGFTT